MANALVDWIFRWDRSSIPSALRAFRPDVNWQEQDLGQVGLDLCSAILASSSPAAQLRARLSALMRRDFRSWSTFRGLTEQELNLRPSESEQGKVWALIDFASWCTASNGKQEQF